MNTQPKALMLADELIEIHNSHADEGPSSFSDAAAELRRLHEQNEMLWKEREEPHKKIDMYVRECNRLEAELDHLQALNQELLEALKEAKANAGLPERVWYIAHAAIAKAQGNQS